jgi:hypothetical protein
VLAVQCSRICLPCGLGGVWEQSFSAVLKQYYSIEQYCGIIYFEVFGNSSEISVH